MRGFLVAAVMATLALSGCSVVSKDCASPTTTKAVGILNADFGLFGQGVSLAIGDICAAAAPATPSTPSAAKTQ